MQNNDQILQLTVIHGEHRYQNPEEWANVSKIQLEGSRNKVRKKLEWRFLNSQLIERLVRTNSNYKQCGRCGVERDLQ